MAQFTPSRRRETLAAASLGAPAAVRPYLQSLVAVWIELREPVFVFLVARIALTILAAYSATSFIFLFDVPVDTYTNRPELGILEEYFFGVWQRWDGQWYLKIATHGYYSWDNSTAFFPLYPLLIVLSGRLTGLPYHVSALVVSSVALLVGLIYLYRLVVADFGPIIARRTLVYLMVFPMSFFLVAVYTESLYLALSVASFYYARRGRWWMAGVLGLLTSATRSTGVVLLVPLAYEYLRQRGLGLTDLYRDLQLEPRAMLRYPLRLRSDVLALALVPGGLLLYMLYTYLAMGDAFAFRHAQEYWQRDFAWPWQTLAESWRLLDPAQNPLIPPQLPYTNLRESLVAGGLKESNGYNLIFTLLAFGLAIYSIGRLPLAYVLHTYLSLLFPLFSPSASLGPLVSMPRFILVIFPLFIALAFLGRHRWVDWLVLYPSLTLLGIFTARFACWYWVA
ncbi:MAG: hypothetical protein HY329_19635 [Chloroflexi bacterium]|nr:hypothetical protein [Chloroflexota bacterium]